MTNLNKLTTLLDPFDFAAYLQETGEGVGVKNRYYQELGVLLYAKHNFPELPVAAAVKEALTVFNSPDGLRSSVQVDYGSATYGEGISEQKPCGGCGGGQVR